MPSEAQVSHGPATHEGPPEKTPIAHPPAVDATEGNAEVAPGHGSTTPWWVFVIAIAAIAVLVILHLTGTIGPGVHGVE